MKSKYAKIAAIFVFRAVPEYKKFFDQSANLDDWYVAIDEVWAHEPWNGVVDEFDPGDKEFWNWKLQHEKKGSVVFWLTLEYSGETLAIALLKQEALPIYGLQVFSNLDEIQSSWE